MKIQYYYTHIFTNYPYIQILLPTICSIIGLGGIAISEQFTSNNTAIILIGIAAFASAFYILLSIHNEITLKKFSVFEYWNLYRVEVEPPTYAIVNTKAYEQIKQSTFILNPKDIILVKNCGYCYIKGKDNILLFKLVFQS